MQYNNIHTENVQQNHVQVDATVQQNVLIGVDPQEAMQYVASAAAALSAAEAENQGLRQVANGAAQQLADQHLAHQLEATAALQQQQQEAAAAEENLRQEAHAALQQQQSSMQQQVSAALQQQQQQAADTQQQAQADLQRAQQEARLAAESRDHARTELHISEQTLKQQRENFHQLRQSDIAARQRELEARDNELNRARKAYEAILQQKRDLEDLIQAQSQVHAQGQGEEASAAGSSEPAPASPGQRRPKASPRAIGTSAKRSVSVQRRRGSRSARSPRPETHGRKTAGTQNADNGAAIPEVTAQQETKPARPVAPPPSQPFRNPEWLEELIARTRKAHELGINVNQVPPTLPTPLTPAPWPGLLPSASGPPPPVVLPKKGVTFGSTPDHFGHSQDLDNSSYVFGFPRGTGGDEVGGRPPPRRDPPAPDRTPSAGGGGDEPPGGRRRGG